MKLAMSSLTSRKGGGKPGAATAVFLASLSAKGGEERKGRAGTPAAGERGVGAQGPSRSPRFLFGPAAKRRKGTRALPLSLPSRRYTKGTGGD